jgi:hypothetical protein
MTPGHGDSASSHLRPVQQVGAMANLTPPVSDALGFFWHSTIGLLHALRRNERFDRWVLSEREQTVKLRR